jgi:hypothetical protein
MLRAGFGVFSGRVVALCAIGALTAWGTALAFALGGLIVSPVELDAQAAAGATV